MEIDSTKNLLSVTETHAVEVEADGAVLNVSVSGSQFLGGSVALKKVQEVVNLTTALQAAGVVERDIEISDVHLDQGSGFKSSNARFSLKIRCHDLEIVSKAIQVVVQQKHITLSEIQWTFSREKVARREWITAVAEKAKLSAEAMAQPLGMQVTGVHRIVEGELLQNSRWSPPANSSVMMEMHAAKIAYDVPPLDIRHTRIVVAQVMVVFEIAPKG